MGQFFIWFFVGLCGVAITTLAGFKATDSWAIWHKKDSLSPTGVGGKGGNAKATNGGFAIGGDGGPGGGPGGGKGGDGGNAEAAGPNSGAIGGDGGGGARSDGRGGKGANSPLKKLPPEFLKQFGLTGNEGYGAGGDGGNTPEYNRRLEVLKILSLEYSKENPGSKLIEMQKIGMPPVDWINKRLSQQKESFRVEFIDNNTDFLFHSINVNNKQ